MLYQHRLKYLLSQSDIFAHFGSGKFFTENKKNSLPASASSASLSKANKKGGETEDLDEDEKAMAEEIGEGDDEGEIVVHPTILSKQPSIIVGGEMRPYQVEGLNWMARLQEYGINGGKTYSDRFLYFTSLLTNSLSLHCDI